LELVGLNFNAAAAIQRRWGCFDGANALITWIERCLRQRLILFLQRAGAKKHLSSFHHNP
jgi:hypothetical protein